MQATCDTAVANGGGWLLALNYLHKGTTNPSLRLRGAASCFPLLRATTLGGDESSLYQQGCGGAWGQLDQATLSQVRARAPATALTPAHCLTPAALYPSSICASSEAPAPATQTLKP